MTLYDVHNRTRTLRDTEMPLNRTSAAVALVLLAGCAEKPDVPLATDGPNQVVIKVPTMT